MKSIIYVTLAIAFISCNTTKKMGITDAAAPTVADKTIVISMKKTMCYGQCPVYEIEIYNDHTAKYIGEKNVDNVGEFIATLPEERYNTILQQFKNASFFEFEKEYRAAVSDLPTTYLFFSYEGKSKKVMDYYGAPKSLKALEKMVVELVNELKWEKYKE